MTIPQVSASNSLVGKSVNDYVGGNGVVALKNGSYVVRSENWDNGLSIDAGSITWGNGTSGVSGDVSATNSLVGSSAYDNVGNRNFLELPNGNYVVCSPWWDNGSIPDVGAVTWGDGTTGVSGTVSVNNSLIGANAQDYIGSLGVNTFQGIIPLSNGNYVVASPLWDNGIIVDAGAATLCDGSIGGVTGRTGVVSSSNSLVGSADYDRVGKVQEVGNSNYVVTSGRSSTQTAVTWSSGTTGITGQITSSNSLVTNKPNESVGNITVLPNGNYIVNSSSTINGKVGAGAVTLCSGVTGLTGFITEANSFVGSSDGDQIGSGGITVLPDSSYIIDSFQWDNGSIVDAGAVTWLNDTTGYTGSISSSNSIIGTSAYDQVGFKGVTLLSNGNYVICSPYWDNGTAVDAGAVTLVNTSAIVLGAVTINNSLAGTKVNDLVGGSSNALLNGNYLVGSPSWNQIGATTWVKGTTGALQNGQINGPVSIANSIIGDPTLLIYNKVNQTYVLRSNYSSGGGQVFIGLTWAPDDMSFSSSSSSSANLYTSIISTPLNTGSATTLQANNDITLTNAVTVNNSAGDGGALTMQAGRSIAINSNLITDNGSLTILANADASTGVIDAQRDSGMGGITLASSAYINAGTGAVSLSTGSATGLTNRSSGGIALNGTLSAGSVAIATAASGSGSPDVLLNSSVTTTGINGIVIAAAGQVQFGTGGTLTSSNSGASISVTGSAINLRGTIATINGEIRLSGPVTQTGYFTANSGTGAIHFTNNWTLGSQIASLTTSQAAIVDGTMSMNSGIVIASGGLSIATNGSLTGNGVIIGSLSMGANAIISPGSAGTSTGDGLLNLGSGSLSLASTSIVSMDGSGRSTFDKIIAGGVTLAGATLNLSLASFTLNTGESITLMDNISSSSTIGTFNGLAEGALFTVNGQQLQIKYTGGDGNDVTVTSVANITASFAVSYSAFFYFPPTATSRSVITLRNTSNSNRNPTMLKLLGVPDRVTVLGATKSGSDWIINLNSAIIWPNGSLGVPVSFKINSGGLFNYTTEIIGG